MDLSKKGVKKAREAIKNAEMISNEKKGKGETGETSTPKIDEKIDDKNDINGFESVEAASEKRNVPVTVNSCKKNKSHVIPSKALNTSEGKMEDEILQATDPKLEEESNTIVISEDEEAPVNVPRKLVYLRSRRDTFDVDSDEDSDSRDKEPMAIATTTRKVFPQKEVQNSTRKSKGEASNSAESSGKGHFCGYIKSKYRSETYASTKYVKKYPFEDNKKYGTTLVALVSDEDFPKLTHWRSKDGPCEYTSGSEGSGDENRITFDTWKKKKPSVVAPKALDASKGKMEDEIVQVTEPKPEDESNTNMVAEGGELFENKMEISKTSISVDHPIDLKLKSDKNPVVAGTSNDACEEESTVADAPKVKEALAIDQRKECGRKAKNKVLGKRRLDKPGTSTKPEKKKKHSCERTKRNKKE